MKQIIIIICLLTSISANAMISRSSNGLTYCVSEYGGNFIIDWKKNTITLHLAGSNTYKIIKEANDIKNQSIILTARMSYYGNEYLELKILSTPSGNFLLTQDRVTKEYHYETARLKCWNEEP